MAAFDREQMARDQVRFDAELDQCKAAMRETIAEMGSEWLIAILEVCKGIDDNNCRPPLPALARFAEIGIMEIVSAVEDVYYEP